MLLKKSSYRLFLRLPSCVLIVPASFIHASAFIIESLWYGKWAYNICPIWCLCQQSSSRIQNEPGYRKRQFLSITTRHQREGQGKMPELKEVKKKTKKNKNKRATNRWTDWREKKERKERKKRGKQRAGRKEEKKKTRTNQQQKREKKGKKQEM